MSTDICPECQGKKFIQVQTGVVSPEGYIEVVMEPCPPCYEGALLEAEDRSSQPLPLKDQPAYLRRLG